MSKCSHSRWMGEGVGKTTLIITVLERLKVVHSDVQVHGFYTQETRGPGGERQGFEAITVDGRRTRLATTASISTSSDSARSQVAAVPKVGKYNVDLEQFESHVLPELAVRNGEGGQQEAASGKELFVIDEVGKMELFSSAFFPAVWAVLDSRAEAVLGTVPIPKFGREIAEVDRIKRRGDVALYTLTKQNRNAMANDIYAHLSSLLKT